MEHPQVRKNMQLQAIALCKTTGYRSAGTVEMLVDAQRNFYFLEMNTRLQVSKLCPEFYLNYVQVEHPITELVTGEDLVEHMLSIAAGHPLPDRLISLPDQCVSSKGWAMECRVYAEDPLRHFLPSVGPLITYREPSESNQQSLQGECSAVRIDSGVFEGGQVGMFYDPMLSKLATHASSRESAISLMKDAVDQYVIRGVENNLCFLRSVLNNEKFMEGDYGTKFISEQYPEGFSGVRLTPFDELKVIVFAASIYQKKHRNKNRNDAVTRGQHTNPYELLTASIPSETLSTPKEYAVKSYIDEVAVFDILPIGFIIEDNAAESLASFTVEGLEWMEGQPLAKLFLRSQFGHKGGNKVEVMQYEGRTVEGILVRYQGAIKEVIIRTVDEYKLSKHMLPPKVKDTSKLLLSPMSGKLLSISVEKGDQVYPGQVLAVVEAMKMQNVLKASKAGVIKEIKSNVGAHLRIDQVILEYE